MSLDNLDAPLRITWEICPPGQKFLTETDFLQVSERLLDAGIFYLLLEDQPLLHPGLPTVLKQVSDGGCQVSLVLGDDPAELDQLKKLDRNYPLFVDAGFWLTKQTGLPALEAFILGLMAEGQKPSLLWVPACGQLQRLPSLMDLCERLDIPRFKLPNHKVPVYSETGMRDELLGPADLELLAKLLEKEPLKTGKTALEIHDLFLWELIFPQGGGERSEYGGCQAGNSLGHVTVNADIWPCSSWPETIGNLLTQDLHSIWESSARFTVRSEVASEPGDCAGCSDYSICFGGCRGLSRSCHPGVNRRDLLCTGPREK